VPDGEGIENSQFLPLPRRCRRVARSAGSADRPCSR
jgi:hypothetical protein